MFNKLTILNNFIKMSKLCKISISLLLTKKY